MATAHYENGIIGTSEGGHTDFSQDVFITGDVFWVDSVNGNDSNGGTNRNEAKATLASAQTAASANNGDVIFLESGHTESLGASLAISKAGLTIVGLGSGSSKPNFTVTAAVDGLDVTGARVRIVGLRFPVGTTATNTSRINIGAAGVVIEDCDFLCGAEDLESITIPDAGDDCEINGCTFTVSADGPDAGIEVEAAGVLGLKVISCTFDGGSDDFDNAGLHSAVAHTEFYYQNNTLSNKASIIHTAAAKGICTGTIAGDGSRVEV